MFLWNVWLGEGNADGGAHLPLQVACTVAGDQVPVVACECRTV